MFLFRLYALESKAVKQGQSQELQMIVLPLHEPFPYMYITLSTYLGTVLIYNTTTEAFNFYLVFQKNYQPTLFTYLTKHKPGVVSNELECILSRLDVGTLFPQFFDLYLYFFIYFSKKLPTYFLLYLPIYN